MRKIMLIPYIYIDHKTSIFENKTLSPTLTFSTKYCFLEKDIYCDSNVNTCMKNDNFMM
jgi:hypothetical protein